jgi:hypothetical protein
MSGWVKKNQIIANPAQQRSKIWSVDGERTLPVVFLKTCKLRELFAWYTGLTMRLYGVFFRRQAVVSLDAGTSRGLGGTLTRLDSQRVSNSVYIIFLIVNPSPNRPRGGELTAKRAKNPALIHLSVTLSQESDGKQALLTKNSAWGYSRPGQRLWRSGNLYFLL